MKQRKKISKRLIAVILCMAIFLSQVNIVDAEDSSGRDASYAGSEQAVFDDDVSEQDMGETTEILPEATQSEDIESTDALENYYQNGKICIYNYGQLQQIGSGNQVYTGDKDGDIGSGDVVKSEGTVLTYSADAQYLLMNDIEMDNSQIWTVADSFTGAITGEAVAEGETPALYDKDSDTVYIYNPYQLMVLAQEDSENEPVMSLDYDAPQFGMGQMIYPDGEGGAYLTYSKSHHYVISQKFDSAKPELIADQVRTTSDGTAVDGRDFQGQVVKTIGDKTYILIGNEEQLRKIGSGDKVYGAVYQAIHHDAKWTVDHDSDGNPIMLYGGDADLKETQNGTEDYTR